MDSLSKAYGATIQMRKADYLTDAYEPSEWRHGVLLQGASNVEIVGLQFGDRATVSECSNDRLRRPATDPDLDAIWVIQVCDDRT